MHAPECLIIGEHGELCDHRATPDGHVLAEGYAGLLRRFGPGTFNDFLHVLPPAHVSTYGERLGMLDDPVLTRHAIFADSDNGDALSWDVQRGSESPLFRFAPRGVTPEPIAVATNELLARMEEGSLASERGPLRTFFLPSRPRDSWQSRARGALSSPSALDAWLVNVTSREDATLLTRREGAGFIALGFWLHVSDAIVRLQHTRMSEGEGWWQLSCTTPQGNHTGVDAFLRAAAAIGVDDRLRAATARS